MIKTVSVQELCEQLETDEQSVLIDLRCPEDFALGHIPQAHNIPLGSMSFTQLLAEWSREAEGKPIYFICQSGTRSQRVIDELNQYGFFGAQCVSGGMVAWQALGLPLVGEFACEPEENQGEQKTRLIFGMVVMMGCTLGFLVHRGFFAIPMIAAAESIFSGITGWSGLALFSNRKKRDY